MPRIENIDQVLYEIAMVSEENDKDRKKHARADAMGSLAQAIGIVDRIIEEDHDRNNKKPTYEDAVVELNNAMDIFDSAGYTVVFGDILIETPTGYRKSLVWQRDDK